MRQNFIVCLEDACGCTVEFERWPYKKAETCIQHMVELYGTYPSLYSKGLNEAARVVCYPTPDGYTRAEPVWAVTTEEFRELMRQFKEER